jgi:ElaB/YqjD/DUF883 family membrane-anchored ribosome-binding protein
MTTTKAKEPPALREQIEELTAAIERAARAEGAEAVRAAGDAARDIAGRVSALVDELAGKAAASESRRQLERSIREQPRVAVSLAAAAGFILATLLRR